MIEAIWVRGAFSNIPGENMMAKSNCSALQLIFRKFFIVVSMLRPNILIVRVSPNLTLKSAASFESRDMSGGPL